MKINESYSAAFILEEHHEESLMPLPDASADYDALFQRYVEICNAAIDAHREEFPYKQVWSAAKNAGVRVAVYDDQPKTEYALRFADERLEAAREGEEEAPAVRLNLSYLREVVEHPDAYIENPSKLDWHWLRSRGGKG